MDSAAALTESMHIRGATSTYTAVIDKQWIGHMRYMERD